LLDNVERPQHCTGMPQNLELTTTQKLVFEFYRDYIEANGVAPPVLLMAEKLGLTRSSVYDALNRLETKGFLKKKPITIKRLMPVKRRTT
jgi:predicted transcriptional regulator